MRLLRCARNDATTLTICDVAYDASAVPVIAYVLLVAQVSARNDATTLTMRNDAEYASAFPVIVYILPVAQVGDLQ